jgi:hypothetical protein
MNNAGIKDLDAMLSAVEHALPTPACTPAARPEAMSVEDDEYDPMAVPPDPRRSAPFFAPPCLREWGRHPSPPYLSGAYFATPYKYHRRHLRSLECPRELLEHGTDVLLLTSDLTTESFRMDRKFSPKHALIYHSVVSRSDTWQLYHNEISPIHCVLNLANTVERRKVFMTHNPGYGGGDLNLLALRIRLDTQTLPLPPPLSEKGVDIGQYFGIIPRDLCVLHMRCEDTGVADYTPDLLHRDWASLLRHEPPYTKIAARYESNGLTWKHALRDFHVIHTGFHLAVQNAPSILGAQDSMVLPESVPMNVFGAACFLRYKKHWPTIHSFPKLLKKTERYGSRGKGIAAPPAPAPSTPNSYGHVHPDRLRMMQLS